MPNQSECIIADFWSMEYVCTAKNVGPAGPVALDQEDMRQHAADVCWPVGL